MGSDTKGITGLEASLEGRTANRQQVALGQCQECIRRLRVFAVDATPRTLGVVEFIRQGDTWKPVNEGVTTEIEKTHQGEAELEAALTAARTVVQEARGERCPHCGWPPGALIGGDADSARAALAKSYSCSQAFRNRMRDVYQGGRVWIHSTRIPGQINMADAPSRYRPSTEEERLGSEECLRVAYQALEVEARARHQCEERNVKAPRREQARKGVVSAYGESR